VFAPTGRANKAPGNETNYSDSRTILSERLLLVATI